MRGGPKIRVPSGPDVRLDARQPNRQEVAVGSFDGLLGLLNEVPDHAERKDSLQAALHSVVRNPCGSDRSKLRSAAL